MMVFLNNFIPLFGSFLSGFSELFLVPMICLSFLATVPYMIRSIFNWR